MVNNTSHHFRKEFYMSDGLKSYGEELNSKEITSFLDYAMKQNDALAAKGKRGTPASKSRLSRRNE